MADPFPISIRKTKLKFKSGSSDKEYHILEILSAADGRALLIKRWGKSDTWGQLGFYAGSKSQVIFERNSVYREKITKGYEEINDAVVVCEAESQFIDKLGAGYFRAIVGTRLGEGKIATDASGRARTAVDAMPEPPKPKPQTDAERYAHNPAWGLFA